MSSPRPAMLCPEPGAAHRHQQRPRPPGSARPRPSAPALLPAQRCPGIAAREPAREAPAPPTWGRAGRQSTGPGPRGPLSAPREKDAAEGRGRGGKQKRRGADGRGWPRMARPDSPVPMAPPPRARPREGGAPRAGAYGTRGRSWQGCVIPGVPHTAPGTARPRGDQTAAAESWHRVQRFSPAGAPRSVPSAPRHEQRGGYGADRTCGVTPVPASPFRRYQRGGRSRVWRSRPAPDTGHRPAPPESGPRTRPGPSPAGATPGPGPDENGRAAVPPAAPGEGPGPRCGVRSAPVRSLHGLSAQPRPAAGTAEPGCPGPAGTEPHCKERQALQTQRHVY